MTLAKHRRSGEGDNEETTAHRRKSPRIQETLNKQHPEHTPRAKSKPLCGRPRPQEIQGVKRQRTARGGRQASSTQNAERRTNVNTKRASRDAGTSGWIHKSFSAEPYDGNYDPYQDDPLYYKEQPDYRPIHRVRRALGDPPRWPRLAEIPSTESPPYFALLRQWLQECDKYHEERSFLGPDGWEIFPSRSQCKPRTRFWPTRVIFVGDSDSPMLELWETKLKQESLLQGGSYIALSHCWGRQSSEEKKQFCTTSENYSQRLKEFTIHESLKTFHDAVKVTRALGIQYLWIDALCIAQPLQGGNVSDWDTEAKLMELVYGSAYCTIAATSAENWKEGFLRRPKMPRYSYGRRRDIDNRDYGRSTKRDFIEKVIDGPLNQRAWVLQELVLSRRVIHFTKTGIYWSCGRGAACENAGVIAEPGRGDSFIFDPDFPKSLINWGYRFILQAIKMLFEMYAGRRLTYNSDRQIAISSLVKRMESVLDTKCRHGIFESYLHRLLLWQHFDKTDKKETNYKDQGLPSWSWMTYSRVSFPPPDLYLKLVSRADLQIDPKRQNILLVQIREFQSCRMARQGSQRLILDAGSKEVGFLSFDMDINEHFCYCVVIGIKVDKAEDAEKTYYILLVKETLLEDQYERVGIGMIKSRCVSQKFYKGELL
ncbi:tol-like protein [Pochonia chlamydosporia 170]|uniref:Tol-like protein n=1 Tax=Pochonia chlamydosporia 170 TaxID=1380566 RepID=A0A179EYW5_METCM|nr:tol-like protein [Pochonia chlamydosporia 170]OAQ58352.2 tol-like protein [Pochonia chlamydosporia 170]